MTEMTGRQRILATLKGEPVDRVPFALNAWQWYYAQKYRDNLPPEFADCDTAIAFHKKIGADLLTRWDGQIKGRAGLGQYVKFPNCKYTIEEFGEPMRMPITTAFNSYDKLDKVRRTLETPHGTLTQVWRFTPESCADFEEQFWVQDFQKQYEALKFMVEDRTYDFEMSEYRRDLDEIGETGIVMVEIPENPVKMLHWLMGPERATLAVMDEMEKCQEMFEVHTQKTLDFIDGVCDRTSYDETPLLMSNDNLDAMLMPPAWFDLVLFDHYKKVSQRVHERGRLFSVHSCGNNWDLRECIRDSGIDMMEGLTPPPLGNFPLHMARQEIGEHFVVEGGMYCAHQELKKGAKEAIDAYSRQLFEEMADCDRFIYSSSCQTSPNTPLDNLYYFREGCFTYGRRN